MAARKTFFCPNQSRRLRPVIGKRGGLNLRGPLLVFGLVVVSAAASAQEKATGAASPVNPFQDLREKTILVITPHPDDDIIGCGGALAFLSGHGNRLIVVFLTAGELGTFDPSAQVQTIRRTRMHEAASAYRTLGFPDAELTWLKYPDGELDFAPQREIRVQLVELIRKRRPDVVFALDPGATYYRYHYRDHRSAALVSADAIGAALWPLEYPQLGPAYRVPEVYYFYTAESTLKLDITEVYEKKLTALAQHRSQFPPAINHFTPQGPPPSRADMESLLKSLTGATSLELFRRR
jgi:LmbE family N-acetylglucosaminyl deacetylase